MLPYNNYRLYPSNYSINFLGSSWVATWRSRGDDEAIEALRPCCAPWQKRCCGAVGVPGAICSLRVFGVQGCWDFMGISWGHGNAE